MAYNLLKGKKGIIFGALNENSIAWKVAERAHDEGASFILTNAPSAIRMGELDKLAEKCQSPVIAADVTRLEDIELLTKKAMEHFGGKFDFILHSVGMSPNVRKGIPYEHISYPNFLKTLDISALSLHKILQTSYNLDALSEWGSVVALSYVAAQRTLVGYNDMADAKALLESIARSFGYIYGRDKHVRVNTVSQSPTLTTAGAGIKGFDTLHDFSNRMSPLGNASADDCADFVVTLFSDLTRKITMQNLFHDGGFSNMGMSLKAITQYNKSFEDSDDKK
jgi:enoyl-[acyl-carrier protein] reductase I